MVTKVLIVSKTQMKNGVCVGGIIESTGKLIRIHNEHGGNLTADVPYQIGDIWEMNVEDPLYKRRAPHTEDKRTRGLNKIKNIGVKGIVNYVNNNASNLPLVRGSIINAFMGVLNVEDEKIYVNHNNTPQYSTEFWIPDRDLTLSNIWDKNYYFYDKIRVKYVGVEPPIDRIPSGTIIRLSLASWWDDGSGEEKCYLQLSGCYI